MHRKQFKRKNLRVLQLVEIREKLGPLHFLNYQNLDLPAAHSALGYEVRQQVNQILHHKLDEYSDEELGVGFQLARKCLLTIRQKAAAPHTPAFLRTLLASYLDCLDAWSIGAGLNVFQHPRLDSVKLDGRPIAALDLALFLQNDSTGCQTGVLRTDNGAVMLWHTEEDVEEKIGSRFDRLRIAMLPFRDGGREGQLFAFIYPDLLPGPAFAWRSDGFVVAVDSLFTGLDPLGTMLANVASWVILHTSQDVEPQSIISALAPFIDAYAVTTIRRRGEAVVASKTEFAGCQQSTALLDESPLAYLFQVNVFSDGTASMAQTHEDISPSSRRALERREVRTRRMLKKHPHADAGLDRFLKMLTSRAGGNLAYANEDVKAFFLCRFTLENMQTWVGTGAAVKGALPLTFKLPLARH